MCDRIDERGHGNTPSPDLFDTRASFRRHGKADLHRFECVGLVVVNVQNIVEQATVVNGIPKPKPRRPRRVSRDEREMTVETHGESIADEANECSLARAAAKRRLGGLAFSKRSGEKAVSERSERRGQSAYGVN